MEDKRWKLEYHVAIIAMDWLVIIVDNNQQDCVNVTLEATRHSVESSIKNTKHYEGISKTSWITLLNSYQINNDKQSDYIHARNTQDANDWLTHKSFIHFMRFGPSEVRYVRVVRDPIYLGH